MISLNQAILKIVINFEGSFSANAIKNFVTNTVWPDIQTDLQNKVQANFTNIIIEKDLQVVEHKPNFWEVYPQIIFSGDTNLSKTQLNTGFDNALSAIKIIVRDHMIAQGATNITYHIHKSTGHVDEQ